MSRDGRQEGKTTAEQRLSTGQLMNIRRITEYSLETYDGDEPVHFMIRLADLSVLSESSVGAGMYVLMNVFKGATKIEMLCLNSRENFEENKGFLRRRTEEERSPAIHQLLKWDQIFLDRIQVQMATARELLVLIRLRNQKGKDVFSYLNRIKKSPKGRGSNSGRADEEDIKRILVVYYKQDVTNEKFEDLDETRWITPDD